jgi:2-polyprenyl-3-methyl-5-hydroxy-6-metoxy-1,4-benzoquinol methylase
VILTYVRFARSSFSARQDSLANARTSPGFFDATEMPTAGWWEALWPAPHKIVTAVGISPDMEVVDLCSGDGWFTLQIAKRAHYVVAIDIEPKLLETARRQYFRVDDRDMMAYLLGPFLLLNFQLQAPAPTRRFA